MAVAHRSAQRQARDVKTYLYNWEGDRQEQQDDPRRAARGVGDGRHQHAAPAGHPRHQGQAAVARGGGRVKEKDITFFTRQLATMMRAGVPLLQSFDIVARGHRNPRFSRLLLDIKQQVEIGHQPVAGVPPPSGAVRRLYCNLVAAGEQAGVLDTVLDRLATYKEKILAIKGKIKSALFYPIDGHRRRHRRDLGHHDLRDPVVQGSVRELRRDLPAPTLIVIAISDFFVSYW